MDSNADTTGEALSSLASPGSFLFSRYQLEDEETGPLSAQASLKKHHQRRQGGGAVLDLVKEEAQAAGQGEGQEEEEDDDDEALPPPPPPPLSMLSMSLQNRTGGAGVRDTSSSSSSSSYFKPNYPADGPVFFIPPAPVLTKTQPPAPPKRAPPAGYDMKTLRSQVSFLHQQVEERERNQQLLHKQNVELFAYIQQLLEAHTQNLAMAKQHIHEQHAEMRLLLEQRSSLADQVCIRACSSSLLHSTPHTTRQ